LANRIFAGGMRSQRPPSMPVTPEMIRETFARFGRIVDMRAGVYAVAALLTPRNQYFRCLF
jgi:hypothetical protein